MSELDALPSVLPPEGVVVTRLAELPTLSASAPRLDVAGVRGCADALVVTALARAPRSPVLVVTEDVDAARNLAKDVRFLLGSASPPRGEDPDDMSDGAEVLVLATAETSPYADVNPDRRSALSRMATLAHLAAGRPFRVLVIAASALARKLVPRDVVRAHTHRIVPDQDIDRDRLIRDLVDAGYLRVPVVEDPGSLAVRGSLLDIWPPGADEPARIELFGDGVLSIKPFDPAAQTTRRDATLPELWLPPARDAILTKEHVERAKSRVLQLADMIDWPTMKTRMLVDDVATGRAFFGADAFLPAYYESLAPLADYLPAGTRVVLADAPAITRVVLDELGRAEVDAQAKAAEPQFLASTFYASEPEVMTFLAAHPVVVLHGAPVAGSAEGLASFEVTNQSVHLAAFDHEDLTRAVKQSRGAKGGTDKQAGGRAGTLVPVARRIRHWKDSGLRVFLTARAQTQAERLAGLLRHQDIRCRVRAAAFDAGWLTEPLARAGHGEEDVDAQIVVGPLGRGVVLPGEGYVIVAEEEIFGGRAHRARERRTRADSAKAFVEDLRSLNVGDYVVHVEHGIGRYQGLVHRNVGGLTVDLLVVEYASGDKLYLPVYRLNQIQKFSGGETGEPKIDRLGGSTFAKTKARVEKAVKQMADELLRLYAERQAQPGDAIEPASDDYRAFEATFPFDETDDQARAIEEVNKDLETARPMDRLVCGDVGFGKTEVAIRAAFRVAMAGKQVAVLCPTTVLAQQHYRVFEARMRDYPITLKALSRFQGKRESDETMAGLKDGKVDIVIGTHRLLSKDIHFKSLGLLVVDEEQRFGVTHKERIKALRTQVDVLTLSATPIPRTLYLSLMGGKDMSTIETPPPNRVPVETTICGYDERI
ncbi:MAG: Transcription-repair coupling factor, partial [Labilithrix sp.]|nr:Transcription-repair coupling factor [Labilithrix sp.]